MLPSSNRKTSPELENKNPILFNATANLTQLANRENFLLSANLEPDMKGLI